MRPKKILENVPTWEAMDDKLRNCDEEFALTQLNHAKIAWPTNMVVRIQKRYNRLRRSRELRELTSTK